MANGTDELAAPGSAGVNITQIPLGADNTPEPIAPPTFELATPGKSGVEKLDFDPINLTPDMPSFSPEVARQRDIFRKYGVDIRPGISLEGTAGRLQSNLSKWANGITKGLGTAVTTFAEPFVDILVGIPTSIVTGKFSGFYNNAASKSLDEFNEYLRKELPNYYTQAERDYGFWRTLGTSNFWADQGMQGLGFLTGAIGSGYVVGASNIIGSTIRGTAMGGVRAWRNLTNAFRGQQLAGARSAKSIDNVKNKLHF